MNRMHVTRALAAGVLSMAAGVAHADFLLPNHNHSQTVGGAPAGANDLHVNLVHVATGAAPTAPPFTANSGTGNFSIDFSGATIPAGGSVTVNWRSKFASDTLDPTGEGHWTIGGVDSGAVTVANLRLDFNNNGGGSMTASLTNDSGGAISYSDLQIFSGADSAFFGLDDYLVHMSTGTPVALLVSSSGVLNDGSTLDIATFNPSLLASTYNAGSIVLDGQLFGMGSSAVPEPGTLILLLSGIYGLLLAARHRRRL